MTAPRLKTQLGFTLIELLVALTIMAVMALLSWRGLDGMAGAQASLRSRTDGVSALQNGLAQWTADLDALEETAHTSALDYDGRVLRLTRRDAAMAGAPLRVVGWARMSRLAAASDASAASWTRWQSQPLRTRAELQQAWLQAARWAQSGEETDRRREVAVVGLDQWQILYYRSGAWSNPLSSAGRPEAAPNAQTNTVTPSQLPDGIRLTLSLTAGQPLAGDLTKDWIRPSLGGGKT